MVEQFFMNPAGLLAVLALIPLAVFYLMKPKPEEKVMPSMRFFQQEKKDDTLRKAYRKLITNLPLLLQILAVLGFAAALANPYINQLQTSENTVMILDRSASVSGSFQTLKDRLEKRTGEKNTLIVADQDVSVLAEEAPGSRIKTILERMDPVHTETDLVSAIQTAGSYRGKLVVASDLDQTADQRSPVEALESQAERPVEVLKPENGNSWGITSVKPGKNSTEVEVTNFREEPVSIKVSGPEDDKEIEMAPGESRIASFTSKTGKNTVKLPEDGLEVDNHAYYRIPDHEEIEVNYIGSRNRYLDEAIKLMEEATISYSDGQDPDVYFINSDIQDDEKVREIRSGVEQGAAAVITSESGALENVFEYETQRKVKNKSLSINKPVRVSLGSTEYVEWGLSGEGLSSPAAIQELDYGEGKVLAYGIKSQEFRQNFLYPIFWKKTLTGLVERPSISQLNLRTGSTVDTETLNSPEGRRYSGAVELNRTGFYTGQGNTYAVNLVSPEESNIDEISYRDERSSGTVREQKSIRNLVAALIILLVGLDMIYLRYRGDL